MDPEAELQSSQVVDVRHDFDNGNYRWTASALKHVVFANPDSVHGTKLSVDSINAGLNFNIPKRRTFIFANYQFNRQLSDADGAFSLPADSYEQMGYEAESGPSRESFDEFMGLLDTFRFWSNIVTP